MLHRPWLLFALAALRAGPALAGSDTHYQDELVGERAAGMGGAFVALGDEATGAFYNPAGISGRGSTLFQVQMSAYKWRRKTTVIADLCGRRLVRDENALYGFPVSLGFVKRLGQTGPVRHALGLHVVLPHLRKESNAFALDEVACAGYTFAGGGSDFTSDRVLVTGLSYALAWRRLQLGATFGIAVRDYASALNVSAVLDVRPGYPLSEMTYVDATQVSLHGALGAIIEVADGLRFGLALTTPYVALTGTGRLDVYVASFSGTRGVVSKQLLDDAEFRWRVPLAIGLGAAYRSSRFTLALDGQLHLPVSPYAPAAHPALPAGAVAELERELVVNVNAGGEVHLGKRWSLRAGFFTNLSSLPDLHAAGVVGSEQLDLYGVTAGATFRTSERSAVSLNLQVMFGDGERLTSEIREARTPDGAPTVETRSVVTPTSERSVSVGLGGNFDIL